MVRTGADLSWRVVSGYAPHALQWIDLQAPVRGCVQANAATSATSADERGERQPDLVCSPRCESKQQSSIEQVTDSQHVSTRWLEGGDSRMGDPVDVMVAGKLFHRKPVKVMANYLDDASMKAIVNRDETGESKYVLLRTFYKSAGPHAESFGFWLFIGGKKLSFDKADAIISVMSPKGSGGTREFSGQVDLLGYKLPWVLGHVQYASTDSSVCKLMNLDEDGPNDRITSVEYKSLIKNLVGSTVSDLHEYARLDELEPGTTLANRAYDVEPSKEWMEFVAKSAKPVDPVDTDSKTPRGDKTPTASELVEEQALKDGVVDEDRLQSLIDRVVALPSITCPENRSAIIEQLERAARLLGDIDESYAREQQLVADLKESNDKLERLAAVLKKPGR